MSDTLSWVALALDIPHRFRGAYTYQPVRDRIPKWHAMQKQHPKQRRRQNGVEVGENIKPGDRLAGRDQVTWGPHTNPEPESGEGCMVAPTRGQFIEISLIFYDPHFEHGME